MLRKRPLSAVGRGEDKASPASEAQRRVPSLSTLSPPTSDAKNNLLHQLPRTADPAPLPDSVAELLQVSRGTLEQLCESRGIAHAGADSSLLVSQLALRGGYGADGKRLAVAQVRVWLRNVDAVLQDLGVTQQGGATMTGLLDAKLHKMREGRDKRRRLSVGPDASVPLPQRKQQQQQARQEQEQKQQEDAMSGLPLNTLLQAIMRGTGIPASGGSDSAGSPPTMPFGLLGMQPQLYHKH